MDKDTLQSIVMGLLGFIMTVGMSVGGYMINQVLEDVRELKHDQDLHVSEANWRLDQGESERKDVWKHYNDELTHKFNFVQEYGEYKIETERRINNIKLELEKLKK